MAVSPSPLNYFIGKGNVYFTPTGGTERHLGNAPSARLEPKVEKKEHFSSMQGIQEKDDTFIIRKSGTLTLTLDEITLENLQMALFGGTIAVGPPRSFELFAANEVTGAIRIEGTNEKGNQFEAEIAKVSFDPGSFDFIGDDYATIELTGECLSVGGSFGTITETQAAA
jgi:hypothetical protein